MTSDQRQASPSELWTVIAITEHVDGGRTLTMRNGHGVTKTENYPPGARLLAVVCPTCRTPTKGGQCPGCGYTIGQENNP